MRTARLLLPLVLGLALAHGDRPGSSAELTFSKEPNRPLLIEVVTEREITGDLELVLFMFPLEAGGQRRSVRRVVAPSEPGSYLLEVNLPNDGIWGFSLRYGRGLDLHYGFVEQPIDRNNEWDATHTFVFRGGLNQGVPPNIQTIGFALLGLIAVATLAPIALLLRRLRIQLGAARSSEMPHADAQAIATDPATGSAATSHRDDAP